MSLSEDGIADSDETKQPRGAVPRVMASLVFAFFAYLGLMLGGGFGTFTSTETNNFAAAKGSQQPHYLTLRDNSRGIVVAAGDIEPKASWHDGNAALIASGVQAAPSLFNAVSPLSAASSLATDGNGGAYLAQGPPVVSA